MAIPQLTPNVEIFVFSALFVALALIGLLIRIISKRMRRQSFSVDDYLLLLSFLLLVAEAGIFCWGECEAGRAFRRQPAQQIACQRPNTPISHKQPIYLYGTRSSPC